MRAAGWVLVSLALVACESSVDLCGTGAVCGTDGVTYTDTCQLEIAGATLDHAGTCTGECLPCDAFECFGTPVLDERGCPTCTCRCSEGDCPPELMCVSGTCVPKDDGGRTDGGLVDAARVDAPMTDAGCMVDTDCEPGRCEGGVCIYPCDPSIAVDCDENGSCETRVGTVDHCTGCDDDCTARAPTRTIPMCLPGEGCFFPCVDGWNRCGGEESCNIDTLVDREHCGTCGNDCAEAEICADGRCVACPDTTRCENRCVDIDTDPMNCGVCGAECDPLETCYAGGCVPTSCLDADDPMGWSCTGSAGSCTCSCGSLMIDVSAIGMVSCGGGLPGPGCLLAGIECSAEYANQVAACCLE